MDFHKELFRVNNEVLSPRNHNAVNRKLQQANRAEKRRAIVNQARNIPLSPQFKDFHSKAAASSTPMAKSRQPRMVVGTKKENCGRVINGVSSLNKSKNQKTMQENLDEKMTRHEAHIRRFIEWKTKKKIQKQQKEHEKHSTRPPFIPVGKPSETSFAPKGHTFQPPACLKDPNIETVKRDSIYIPVPTPPKRKESNHQKSTKMQMTNFDCKTSGNNLVRKRILAIKSFAALKEAELGNVAKISGVTTAKKFVAKINNIKEKNSQDHAILKHTCESSQPQSIVKSAPKFEHKPSKFTLTNNFQRPNGTAISRGVTTINQQDLAKDSSENVKKDNFQKATFSNRKELIPLFTVQTEPEMKSNCKIESLKLTEKEVTKNTQSSGAIGKAKGMNLRKNTVPPSLKPKLAVNLKAKKTNIGHKTNAITAAKRLNREPVKRKDSVVSTGPSLETKAKTLSTSKCSNTLKVIHTIAKGQTQVSTENSKARKFANRESLQEKTKDHEAIRRRKFNFLKQIEFDTTNVDSPIISSTTKENLEIESNANKEGEKKSHTPQNAKVVSKILKKLQIEFSKEPCKKLPPIKTTLPVRRSLKMESSPTKTVNRKNKKFNFLVNVELDATAVELEETIPGQDICQENGHQDESGIEHEGDVNMYTKQDKSSNLASTIGVSSQKEYALGERKQASVKVQKTPINIIPVNVETPIEKRRALEAVNCFRKQLQEEIERLHALCDQWDAYKEEKLELLQASDGEDMINVTTGQTRLLTSKKFMQFNGLIDRCEAHANGTAPFDDGSEDTKAITPVDLEGFWSMLGLQIENIQKRFENLERWKANGWKDPDAIKPKHCIRKKSTKTKSTADKPSEEGKPRGNTALRQMMRRMRAEKHSKDEEAGNTAQLEEIKVFLKKDIPSCSPRRLRRSIHRNENFQSYSPSNTPGRINIVVPNRRSRSLARTIISVPSPVRASPQRLESSTAALQNNSSSAKEVAEKNELLKKAILGRTRRSRSLQMKKNEKSPSPTKIISKESPPRTPISNVMIHYGRKSILKTPGTGRNQLRNVIFNDQLSVKKFRPLKYDDDHQGTEYEAEQQVHIDDFINMKSVMEFSFAKSTVDRKEERTYHLRNRRVKLRPSCEIEMPK